MMMVLPSLVSAYDFEVNGICYTVTSFEEFTVAVDGFSESLSGTIEIPSTITYSNKVFSVTTIKSGQSSNIASVIIPASIFEIGEYAFSGSSIRNMVIPDNVTTIGVAAFKGCTNLYSVKISKNVTSLAQELFEGCTSLVEIDWHPECTYGSIYGRCFYNCSSLKTFRLPAGINLTGGMPKYHSGTSAAYYTSIFKNCTSLDSLIIEDGEGTIHVNYNEGRSSDNTYYGEFYGCKINYVYLGRPFEDKYKYSNQTPILRYVEHLEIGDKVTVLPTWLPNQQNYGDAKHLKTLIIGSSLTKVADFSNTYNFDGTQGNQSLEFIKMKGTTPPEAVGFSNYNYINTILYVPKGSKAAYESANIWKNFWNIQEYTEDGTQSETKKCAKPTISYYNGNISVNCLTEGAVCQSTITDSDIKSYSSNEIQLSLTYNISVYATKPGYENSEIATATLCWVDLVPKTEGIENSVSQIRAKTILIQSHDGLLNINGVENGQNICVYNTTGTMIGSAKSFGETTCVSTGIRRGEIVIIKIGEKAVKYMMK